MQQGHKYGMQMPTPQFPVQPSTNSPRNVNGFDAGGRRFQADAVVSTMNVNILELADNSELQELHDKDEKLYELVDENSEVQQLHVEREMQLAGNRSLAEYNMAQAPKLSACKERLTELYKQLNEQTQEFEGNRKNLESLSEQFNPDTIMALLQTSVAQSEESSEKLADRFMEGDLSVEDFLDKYLEERTTLHVRHTKVDKLKELTRRQ